MRYIWFIFVVGCLALGACTYTKKDSSGRDVTISREEYEALRK